jgi:two-component system LytT family response regulator/two-component system response regulator AlgR
MPAEQLVHFGVGLVESQAGGEEIGLGRRGGGCGFRLFRRGDGAGLQLVIRQARPLGLERAQAASATSAWSLEVSILRMSLPRSISTRWRIRCWFSEAWFTRAERSLTTFRLRPPSKSFQDSVTLRASIRPDLPVVFVTAHAEHAVESFSQGVVDFLLKPVTTRRLALTMERLRWLVPRVTAAPQPSPALAAGEGHRRYPAWADGGVVFLDLALTDYFEVTHQVVWAITGQTRLRTRWTSLAEVESHFPDAGLLRIHRHLLVRPQAVRGLRSSGKGNRVVLQMAGGEALEASRGATPRIKSRLELLNQQTLARTPGRSKPEPSCPGNPID